MFIPALAGREINNDEIAEITGTNRNNVAIKLHRIKEKLKNMSNL